MLILFKDYFPSSLSLIIFGFAWVKTWDFRLFDWTKLFWCLQRDTQNISPQCGCIHVYANCSPKAFPYPLKIHQKGLCLVWTIKCLFSFELSEKAFLHSAHMWFGDLEQGWDTFSGNLFSCLVNPLCRQVLWASYSSLFSWIISSKFCKLLGSNKLVLGISPGKSFLTVMYSEYSTSDFPPTICSGNSCFAPFFMYCKEYSRSELAVRTCWESPCLDPSFR